MLDGVDRPAFLFMNLGETHVPYYHEGAPWSPDRNPCIPFGADNDAGICRHRQIACIECIDRRIAALLERFAGATIVICGDRGDCWGEDGFWEHGFCHPKLIEVPLLFRIAASP